MASVQSIMRGAAVDPNSCQRKRDFVRPVYARSLTGVTGGLHEEWATGRAASGEQEKKSTGGALGKGKLGKTLTLKRE